MNAARAERHEVEASLERWRGAIDEQLKGLARGTESLRQEFKDERDVARQHRESLRMVITANSAAIATLTERVAEMRPTVQQLEARGNQAQGIIWALRAFWAVVGGLAVAGLSKIIWWR